MTLVLIVAPRRGANDGLRDEVRQRRRTSCGLYAEELAVGSQQIAYLDLLLGS